MKFLVLFALLAAAALESDAIPLVIGPPQIQPTNIIYQPGGGLLTGAQKAIGGITSVAKGFIDGAFNAAGTLVDGAVQTIGSTVGSAANTIAGQRGYYPVYA